MANTRGNTYSRNHTRGLFPYQQQFWHFSMDELALQDLPTQIDYILQRTGANKLAFAGHSQVWLGVVTGGAGVVHTARLSRYLQQDDV